MYESFDDLGLHDDLLDRLNEVGYKTPTPIQASPNAAVRGSIEVHPNFAPLWSAEELSTYGMFSRPLLFSRRVGNYTHG